MGLDACVCLAQTWWNAYPWWRHQMETFSALLALSLKSAGRIFSFRSSVELSWPVVLHRYSHFPICPHGVGHGPHTWTKYLADISMHIWNYCISFVQIVWVWIGNVYFCIFLVLAVWLCIPWSVGWAMLSFSERQTTQSCVLKYGPI